MSSCEAAVACAGERKKRGRPIGGTVYDTLSLSLSLSLSLTHTHTHTLSSTGGEKTVSHKSWRDKEEDADS